MKKLLLILLTIISIGLMSCASNRLVSYKPSKGCPTYNDVMRSHKTDPYHKKSKCCVYSDVTPLNKRKDIPRSLRNDYNKYK